MIDFQRIFHNGLLVPDLAWGMDHYGRTLGLDWFGGDVAPAMMFAKVLVPAFGLIFVMLANLVI